MANDTFSQKESGQHRFSKGDHMFRLDGKTAIVTGGGSGIGRGIVELFAKQGATVVILDRDTAMGEKTRAELEKERLEVIYVAADVTDHHGMMDCIESIWAEQGPVEILVNNAGIAHIGDAATTSEEDFDRVMAVNCKGVYNVSHAVLPRMASDGGGVILNISSTVAWFGLADRFAYTASKGAVTAMTYSIAKDFVDQNIRCNAILPGRIHTPFVDGFVKENFPDEQEQTMQRLSDYQPIGRMGTPFELASAALYLCSDEASFVTGSIHAIDGGTISLR